MEQQDLNAEYGRIFGVVHYPTLFDKDDSAYSELRKEIIDTPRLFTSTNKLPFESIYDFSIEQEIDCNRDYLEQNRVILTYMMSLLGLGIMSQQLLPASYLF